MKTDILQHPWQSSAVKEDFCWLQSDVIVVYFHKLVYRSVSSLAYVQFSQILFNSPLIVLWLHLEE